MPEVDIGISILISPAPSTQPSIIYHMVDKPFQWQLHHQIAVDKIKEAISSANSLQCFDSTKPVTIQVDALSHGLWYNLVPRERPH